MPPSSPRILRAEAQDRPTVLRLLSDYLPDADVAVRYDWLYQGNPHGRAVTFVATDNDGTPMGLTSLFPRRVVVDGVVRTGAMGGDGYVAPAFRRRGVATALHGACLDFMVKSSKQGAPGGVEFMFGAPAPNNLKALERAGSRIITRLRRYARPRAVQRVLSGLGRLCGRRSARLVELSTPDRSVAEIWERVASAGAVMPVRDPAHYAWRFGGATPERRQKAFTLVEGGRAVALCALERRDGMVAIVDFLAPPERRAAALRAIADATHADRITMIANELAPSTVDLLLAGFFPREAQDFQVLAPAEHPARAALFDPRRWYFTSGDEDVDRVL